MAVSTRTRFEVLKRDGFRCRHCGTDPVEDGMPKCVFDRLPSMLDRYGFERTAEALQIAASRGFWGERALEYVYGTLRKMAKS